MYKPKRIAVIVVLGSALVTGALWYAAVREIRKESDLANDLELPYREAPWTMLKQGMRPYQMPGELNTLRSDLPEAKFNDLNAQINLRLLNIQTLRQAALDTEEIIRRGKYVTAYSGSRRVAIVANDGSDAAAASIRSLLRTLPGEIELVVVEGNLAGKVKPMQLADPSSWVMRYVTESFPPDAQMHAAPPADIANAIYDVPADGERVLAHTLLQHTGDDLSWPDTAYLDTTAERIGARSVSVPLTAAATEFIAGISEKKDLFVSEKAIEEEMNKRDRMMIGVKNRQRILNAYARVFGADRVWAMPIASGLNSLSAMVKIVGEKHALVAQSMKGTEALQASDIRALERCAEILAQAGYRITRIPTTKTDVANSRSPLSGLIIPGEVNAGPALLVPVDPMAGDITPDTAQALSSAGVRAIATAYQPRGGVTLGQSVALLR